jgi:transposase-like protein
MNCTGPKRFARLRWSSGAGLRVRVSRLRRREHCIVKRGTRSLYQCNACRKQTSVKAGTILASSKLPLRFWFKAMYLMTQSKKGISSIELGPRLSVTQTTAWTLKHKLAQVMIERNAAKRLTGEVQMDDALSAATAPEHTAAALEARRLSWPPFL